MDGVREECVAALLPAGSPGDGEPRGVDRDHARDRRERPPRRVHLDVHHPEEPRHRGACDEEADEDEEAGFGERGEVLRLAVAERMALVRRPDGDGDGEEREQGGCEVRTRVSGFREKTEARAREPGGELDHDQEARGSDRDERSAPLRRHARKRMARGRQPTAA